MPPIAECQMHKTAPLILTLMRQEEREVGGHTFPHYTRQASKPFRELVGFAWQPWHWVVDNGTMEMVIESHSEQLATRITKSKYAEAQGQRGGDGHQKQLLRLRLFRLTKPVADPLFQSWRHRNIPDRLLKPSARVAALLCLLSARIAASEVLDHFEIAFRQQFVVDVRIELRPEVVARLLAKSCLSHNQLSF
jgi:hypothetical protein